MKLLKTTEKDPMDVKRTEQVYAINRASDVIPKLFARNEARPARVIAAHEIVDYFNSQFGGATLKKNKNMVKAVIPVPSPVDAPVRPISVDVELDPLK